MQRDPRAWLWDAQAAAEAIETFVSGLDAPGYAASELVHSAVERKFEIIGEALNQLAKANPAPRPAFQTWRRSLRFEISSFTATRLSTTTRCGASS
jgi:uncharacterized protein with HEPN domain